MNQMWFNVGYMLDKWFRDIRGSLSTRGNRGRRLLGLDRAKRVFYSVWSARLNYNWVDHGMVFGSQVLRVWIPHTYLQQWKGEGERFVQQGSLPDWYFLEETVQGIWGVGDSVSFSPTLWFGLYKNSRVRKSGILF